MSSEIRKTVADSFTSQSYIIMPAHLNNSGTLFGGQLMSWIDMLAGIVAIKHCRSRVVTIAIDSLVFKNSAYEGDIVTLEGKVTWVGNTSMEIMVDTFRENNEVPKTKINTATLVMVCVDDEGKPSKVPGLELKTEAEELEWHHAARRSELRKQRQKENI